MARRHVPAVEAPEPSPFALPGIGAVILQLLKPYKKRIVTIAVESTFNWYWLVDGLQDQGYHVVLANPAPVLLCLY